MNEQSVAESVGRYDRAVTRLVGKRLTLKSCRFHSTPLATRTPSFFDQTSHFTEEIKSKLSRYCGYGLDLKFCVCWSASFKSNFRKLYTPMHYAAVLRRSLSGTFSHPPDLHHLLFCWHERRSIWNYWGVYAWCCGLVTDTLLWDQRGPGSSPGCAHRCWVLLERLFTDMCETKIRLQSVKHIVGMLEWCVICNGYSSECALRSWERYNSWKWPLGDTV